MNKSYILPSSIQIRSHSCYLRGYLLVLFLIGKSISRTFLAAPATNKNNNNNNNNIKNRISFIQHFPKTSIDKSTGTNKEYQLLTMQQNRNSYDDNNNNKLKIRSSLIPSQAIVQSSTVSSLTQLRQQTSSTSISASTDINNDVGDTVISMDSTDTSVIESVATNTKRSRRRRPKGKNGAKVGQGRNNFASSTTKSNTGWFNNSTKNSKQNFAAVQQQQEQTAYANPNNTDSLDATTEYPWLFVGNYPDIYWKSISMDHLRLHPNFVSLPESKDIKVLHTIDDVQNFRQDSWQWDMLHKGRCTTSQAVAALGFLEYDTAEVLDIPKSWRRGGTGAYYRLQQQPIRTLQDMNRILCNTTSNKQQDSISTNTELIQNDIWSSQSSSASDSLTSPYVTQYNYHSTKNEISQRDKFAIEMSKNDQLGRSIRMVWGNVQEATSVLTAINYFAKHQEQQSVDTEAAGGTTTIATPTTDFCVRECGMYGAGLAINVTDDPAAVSLLIGATPDGLICHTNGTVEVLEVKNHCPFFRYNDDSMQPRVKKTQLHRNGYKRNKRFGINEKPFTQEKLKGNGNGVFTHYIPQLMMEMYCVGEHCKSAIMIRQTASVGAMILRIYRNDEWIQEMLYWLQQFQTLYVNTNTIPPKNFFYNNTNNTIEQARYRRFVNKTLEIRNSHVKVVTTIPNNELQRGNGNTPLFLDDVLSGKKN